MDPAQRVESIIAPSLQAMGYDVVRVRLSGAQTPVLQVMAERSTDGSMTVEDCAEVSRAVSALLDVEDPIQGAYNLEVSSPGIDRPLTRLRDYDRYAGFEARVETRRPVDGRKRFRGKVMGADGDHVKLATDTGEVRLPFAEIDTAKLVLTDELIAASLKQNKQ